MKAWACCGAECRRSWAGIEPGELTSMGEAQWRVEGW